MADLPSANDFNNIGTTEAQFKAALQLLVENVAGKDWVNANRLFKPVALTAAADFNTLVAEGRTVVPTDAIAAACTNRPSANAGILDVALIGSGVIQTYRVFEQDLAYERQKLSDATWTDWVQLASKDMVDTGDANTLQGAKDYADANRLFKPVSLTAAADFNTLVAEGRTIVPTDAIAVACTNRPSSVAGVLDVALISAGVLQAYTAVTGARYTRTYISSTWSAWVDVVLAGTITASKLSQGYTASTNLIGNENLNTVAIDGNHYAASGHTCTNLPSDFTAGASFVLNVSTLVELSTRFKLQRIYLWNTPDQQWLRQIDMQTNTATAWVDMRNGALTRPNLASNADLNLVTKDGYHYGASSAGYSNLPAGFDTAQPFMLFNTSGTYNDPRFKQQTLFLFNTPEKRWVRRVDTQGTSTAWVDLTVVSLGQLSTVKLPRTNLADNYMSNGSVTSGNLNSLTKDGAYTLIYAASGWTNYPPTTASVQLFNTLSTADWIIQRAVAITDATVQFTRTLRRDAQTSTAWVQTAIAGSTLPLAGKKIAYLGDSVVEFGTIPEQVATLTGATVYKLGFGGCRMSFSTNALYDTMSMSRISDAIKNNNYTALIQGANDLFTSDGDDNRTQANLVSTIDWSTVDIAVIAFGTNDYSGNVPLGVPSDFGTTTFYGAINKVVDDILTSHPQIKIVFTTPFYRSRIASGDGKNTDDFANTNGVYMSAFVDALIERCNAHKLPFKDLYRKSAINKINSAYWLSDGVHPSTAGYTAIAQKMASFLRSEF